MRVETDEFPCLPTLQGWNEEIACGVSLDGLGAVCCVAWADNPYCIARSASAARDMVEVAVRERATHGMHLKADDMLALRSDVGKRLAGEVAPFLHLG